MVARLGSVFSQPRSRLARLRDLRATIRNSVLFSRVTVDEHSLIEDSVVLPDVKIGRNVRIKRAVIDRGCLIPDGTVIGENPEDDNKRFRVTGKGVVLVVPEMLGQDFYQAG